MTKKTEEVQEMQETQLPQSQVQLVDERPLPRALVTLIQNSNRELQLTQQRLMNEITESSQELMDMLSLKQEEGWLLDIEGLRFVKVEQPAE
tara:strand:- start:1038 stop:1313 length:276 start_codon:yes stop_codon:yes gene_type:complete